jgi:UDP-N-acetylglucosamine 2-epimerase
LLKKVCKIENKNLYGDGKAGEKIVNELLKIIKKQGIK